MIKIFKKYVIDSQFYVSLVATMLATFFMLERSQLDWGLVALVFFTYFNGYLYTKYQANKKVLPIVLIFNAITFLLCIGYVFSLGQYWFLWRWLVIIFLGLLYNSSFLDFHIRSKPFLKVFYVGLVWGLTNAWLVLPDFNLDIFIINFFFISGLVLPFDIRDMDSDRILTFPRVFGVARTKEIAYILVFVAGVIAVHTLRLEFALAFLLTMAFTFILIYFSKPKRPDLFYSFGVETMDGVALLFFLLIHLLRLL